MADAYPLAVLVAADGFTTAVAMDGPRVPIPALMLRPIRCTTWNKRATEWRHAWEPVMLADYVIA